MQNNTLSRKQHDLSLRIKNLVKEANLYPSWQLTDRQICDLELIMNGGFSPLTGFLSKADYISVLKNMRLENGALWPIPITLDVSKEFVDKIKDNEKIALRDKEGFALSILTITDLWEPDLEKESHEVYGTNDIKHPAVNYLYNASNKYYIGGNLENIRLPNHYDYKDLRHTPEDLKKLFTNKGWGKIVAFQTRNPLHKAHVEMINCAVGDLNAGLLVHPVVGMTKPGDVDHYTRVRCYMHALKKFPNNSAILSLLPLAMRMGGPKEAIWHALIRKNYGCTHLIVGRDHAGPGLDSKNNQFYEPYEAQKLLKKYQKEIGIDIVPFKFMVFSTNKNRYEPIENINNDKEYKTVSGTELRNMLDKGLDIPEWFTYKEVAYELKCSRPPLAKRGFTIFFTGLSGSGKSTLANGLFVRLLEEGSRPVTILDGDIVRSHLSSELGFSKEHRSLNVRRIGYVASEITKNGGIAICAPIAPYRYDRRKNRDLISPLGGFIEIYVNTPLAECEKRDVKGLYELARKGIVKEFTGISDPYEKPEQAEIEVNSSGIDPEKLVDKILLEIKQMGYIA